MSEPRWHTGDPAGRALYCHRHCVGMVDSKELADEIVAAMNGAAPNDRQGICEALSREANRIWGSQAKDFPSNVLDVVSYYRQAGNAMMFWLSTHPSGRWIKGEGFTDNSAMGQPITSLRESSTGSETKDNHEED